MISGFALRAPLAVTNKQCTIRARIFLIFRRLLIAFILREKTYSVTQLINPRMYLVAVQDKMGVRLWRRI